MPRTKKRDATKAMFRDPSGQNDFFEKSYEEELEARKNTPVTCLGREFPNDDARRDYFLSELAKKLKDPDFRKIEGFPIGEDEDILALSDPPYYTACPNPWIADVVAEWEKTKPKRSGKEYSREPFAIDVSEGKTDPLYKAHSYHTKVPHLAIVPSILHYTDPGDIVLDGFCGSGMTGVAAQWCGAAPESYRKELEAAWKRDGRDEPKWGARRVVLNDLSPAATFIAANYNLPLDVEAFARAGRRLLDDLQGEIGWMYETLHVEPASSRLTSDIGFVPCNPFNANTGLENPPDGVANYVGRRDNLPHKQFPGATYFVTFRTHDYRKLSEPAREIALKAVKHWDGIRWKLVSAVVMPDHVHLIARILPKTERGACLQKDSAGPSDSDSRLLEAGATDVYWDLSDILHSVKSFSANEINKTEGTTGVSVWQTESYDRIVRDEHELANELAYTNHNPVKAGIVERTEDYPWRFVAPEVIAAGWKPALLGRIEYTVWSEVFTCPECSGDVVFLDEALDAETGRVRDVFACPHCKAEVSKRRLDRAFSSAFDKTLKMTVKVPRRRPSVIHYSIQGTKYTKRPDNQDIALLDRIGALDLPPDVPIGKLPYMHMTHERARMDNSGITHTHHFFLPRAAHALAHLWRAAQAEPDSRTRRMLLFMVEQAIWTSSVLNRFRPTGYSQVNQYMTGVYYVPSQHTECSPWYILDGKRKRLASSFGVHYANINLAAISTGTAAVLRIGDSVVDYIFTDPPFGENIYYADLNYLVESWHRVSTDAQPEAIVDRAKKKGLPDYQRLMQRCFEEYHRVLKPGHWMTVVFHNSRNSVWTAIQEGMLAAGFVVADVRTMDKQQGSYRQVTSSAMKQDLVISAYKPTEELERRFQLEAGTEAGMWKFVEEHLRQLPTFVTTKAGVETIAERTGYMLFDRMIAFHVQRGATVPMSAAEFFHALASKYSCRDEMYFLPSQATEYDKERSNHTGVLQFELFVSDEASAIGWLHQQLSRKPQTTQELTPLFINELRAWQKHEKPLELRELLEHNFLCYSGGDVPSQIHAYLSTNWKELRAKVKDDPELVAKAKGRWYVPDPKKAEDLERVRERALLREFWEYLPEGHKPLVKADMQAELPGLAESKKLPTGRRMKVIRTEAVRVGFKYCWQHQDYRTIITVAKRIPEDVLQEDSKLLMWYDQALTRLGEE